jgi:aspartate/methionine/tyrosine aminotransferase
MGRADHIPLWFGEADTPTSEFTCDAAARELAAGDILYRPNPGVLLVRRCARAAEAGRARLERDDQR